MTVKNTENQGIFALLTGMNRHGIHINFAEKIVEIDAILGQILLNNSVIAICRIRDVVPFALLVTPTYHQYLVFDALKGHFMFDFVANIQQICSN